MKHPSRINHNLDTECPPCFSRPNVTEPDEKASSTASPMPTWTMSTGESFDDPNQDEYFHRGVVNTGATMPMCPEASSKATAMANPSADWLKSPYILFLIFGNSSDSFATCHVTNSDESQLEVLHLCGCLVELRKSLHLLLALNSWLTSAPLLLLMALIGGSSSHMAFSTDANGQNICFVENC